MSISHPLLPCMHVSVGKGFDPPRHLKLREVSKSLYHRDESEQSSVTQQTEADEHRKQDAQLSAFPYLLYISQLTDGITFNRKKRKSLYYNNSLQVQNQDDSWRRHSSIFYPESTER